MPITIFSAPFLPNTAFFCPYLTRMLLPSVYNYMFLTSLSSHWQHPESPCFYQQSVQGNLSFLYHTPQKSFSFFPLPGSKAPLTFLGIFYSSTPLLGNKISINFLLFSNKLPQKQWLKATQIYYVKVSVNQESRHGLTESSTQDLTGLK